jgi:hypothetical protein
MKELFLAVMILVVLSTLWLIGRAIILRGKCLDDDEIRDFVKGRVDSSSAEY